MELNFDCRTKMKIPGSFEGIVRIVAEQVFIQTRMEANYEVSVSIVDNVEIRSINKHFRNIDKETDVLSFPLMDFENAGRREETETLGDIIISAEKVFSQALLYGHSPEREIGFLTAHGMLHLLGYDHMNPEDEKEMLELQDRIMYAIGLERQSGC